MKIETEDLYTTFGEKRVQLLFRDPSFISQVDKEVEKHRAIAFDRFNWDASINKSDIEKASIVYMFSKSRECSIERACVKLRFPANRYVKYHTENMDTLNNLYKAYKIESRCNIRNELAYHILSAFNASSVALEELGFNFGDRATNNFLAYMRSKQIQITASNIIDTFFNLDSEQKKKIGIVESIIPRPRF